MAAPPPTYDELHPQESTEESLRARVAELEARIAELEPAPAAKPGPGPGPKPKPPRRPVCTMDWPSDERVADAVIEAGELTEDEAASAVVRLERARPRDAPVEKIQAVARVVAAASPEIGEAFVLGLYYRIWGARASLDHKVKTVVAAAKEVQPHRDPDSDLFTYICRCIVGYIHRSTRRCYDDTAEFFCIVRDTLQGEGHPVDAFPPEALAFLYRANYPLAQVADLLSTTDPRFAEEAVAEAAGEPLTVFQKFNRRKILKALKARAAAAAATE